MSRRGGPYPRLRLDLGVKVEQGVAVMAARNRGASFAKAGEALGLSATTAWRRWWFVHDWTLPGHYGRPLGELPPQRGTRACPRGRPCRPTLDHWELQPRRVAHRCIATCRDGRRCRNPPRTDADVCRMHGGSAPQVLASAGTRRVRLKALRAAGHRLHQEEHR